MPCMAESSHCSLPASIQWTENINNQIAVNLHSMYTEKNSTPCLLQILNATNLLSLILNENHYMSNET